MIITTRQRRDCQCAKARHVHGTTRAYVADKCRCPSCTRANSRMQKANRLRQHQHGAYTPLTFPFAVGVARRLQALAVCGWSTEDIGRVLGTDETNVARLRLGRGDRVTAATHAKVVQLYDRVWNQPPPGRYAKKVRNLATRYGWAPPLAWDDEWIDDPGARPHLKPELMMVIDEIAIEEALTGRRIQLNPAERAEAARIGTARGMSITHVAGLLHAGPQTIAEDLARAAA